MSSDAKKNTSKTITASKSYTITGGDAKGGGVEIVKGEKFEITGAEAGAGKASDEDLMHLMNFFGVPKVAVGQAKAQGFELTLEAKRSKDSKKK